MAPTSNMHAIHDRESCDMADTQIVSKELVLIKQEVVEGEPKMKKSVSSTTFKPIKTQKLG